MHNVQLNHIMLLLEFDVLGVWSWLTESEVDLQREWSWLI